MNKRKKKFIGNLIYAFAAQSLSFALSVLMSIIVPKVLSLNDFGYWQLFIFYTSYVGFFHFGFNDGVYLLNGGKKYEDLDCQKIGGAFWVSFFVQLVLGGVLFALSSFLNIISARRIVLFCTIIYMLIFNSSFCLGYIFQAVNDTKKYSKSVMIDKICFMFFLAILLVCRVDNFVWFVICYILSKFISYVYCLYYGKKIVFIKNFNIAESIKCYKESVSIGFNLTIAGVASMLILGVGRIIIDSVWGIEEFAKFSLVLSLASFAIMFISQVSMVLFPSLRQVSAEEQKSVYQRFRCLLSVGLPAIFIISVPLKVLMQMWLPQYAVSLNYLFFALPICFFDAKMNLLCNTYFKVLREEKYLRKINIISFVFSLLFCGVSGYIFKSSILVLLAMVSAVAFRSIVSEIHLAKLMESSINTTLFYEVLFVILILLISVLVKNHDFAFFCLSVILYVIFLLFNKKNVNVTKSMILGMFDGKK